MPVSAKKPTAVSAVIAEPTKPELVPAEELEEPKKPMTAYFLYLNENRDALAKELGPQAAKVRGAVTQLGSKKWNALPQAEKSKIEAKAAVLKKEYDQAIAEFKEAGGQVGKRRADKKAEKTEKQAKRAKKLADTESGKPKKPVGGAYGCYMTEHRAEIHKNLPAGSAASEVAKVAGAQWKALGAKERAKYEKMYELKAANYKKELEEWQKNQPEDNGDDTNEEAEEEDEE